MKLRIALLLVLALLVGGLVVAERRRAQAAPSAQSLLYLIADSERDLTRLPSHFTRLRDADEIAAGKALAEPILAERGKLTADDEQVEAYLNQLRARVAPHAHRRLPYRFHYLPERAFVNAFALPGGPVFVGAGLLERMTTEDELVSVLAHEVEHIDHYHCAERLQVEAALRRIRLGAVLGIPVAVFQAGYSKDQELEADREGVLLAARSGYSAAGALRAFGMIDTLLRERREAARTPQEEAAHVAADALTGYFRSHPQTPERMAQVRAMLARQPELAAPPERPLAVEYIFMARKSLDAVAAEKFALAAELASRALQKHAGHPAAMQALCEAHYGLGHDAAAASIYRELLARDTAAADAAEKWGEERAEKLANSQHYGREIALVESLLTVQPSQQRLLRLAAWAYAMNGDAAAAAEKAATIRRLYADAAPQLAANAEKSAADLLAAKSFAPAANMASLALVLEPRRREALQTLGNAEFAQAHFTRAAAAYKNLFDANNSDAAWLRSLADSLGAAHPAAAARELQAFFSNSYPPALDAAASVESAGLALLSGSDERARAIVQLVDRGGIAPEVLGRLGWWYLRANRPADADAVLRKARSLRPGDTEIQNVLAWTMLEEGKGSSTIAPFAPPPASILENDADVHDALVEWQLGHKPEAVRRWSAVAQSKPQWLNPEWRIALYPPRINELAQAVDAERLRVARAGSGGMAAALHN